MIINRFKRYENKYVLNQEQYKKVLSELKEHMELDDYCINNKTYKIYNIYLDNDNNDIIRQSIETTNFKEKMRIRCYNEHLKENEKVFLEMKRKCNKVVNKRRIELTIEEVKRFIDQGIPPIRENYIDLQIINEFKYYLQINKVKPKLYLTYTRLALITKSGIPVRITFDNNIKTRRENVNFTNGAYGEDLISKDMYLMEIKVQDCIPLWLVKILSNNKIYKNGFSKYGTEYKKEIGVNYVR